MPSPSDGGLYLAWISQWFPKRSSSL